MWPLWSVRTPALVTHTGPGPKKEQSPKVTTDMFADCDEPQASVSDVEERRVAERDEGRSRRGRTRDDVDPENVRDRPPARCSVLVSLARGSLWGGRERETDLRSGRKRREMRTSPLRLRMKKAEIMFRWFRRPALFPAPYFQTLLLPSCTRCRLSFGDRLSAGGGMSPFVED